MTKMMLDVGVPPSVFNSYNAFPRELTVEKAAHTHGEVFTEAFTPDTEFFRMPLDLYALGQGMLDALEMMQADGYEPEPVYVSDEMLAEILAFSIGD